MMSSQSSLRLFVDYFRVISRDASFTFGTKFALLLPLFTNIVETNQRTD